MFYEYEDYLNEPSEADKVIEEMKDRLHGLIKNEVKGMMEEYRKAKDELSELDLDISRKRGRINNLNRMIEELEEKYEHTDKHKMPRKYIDSFVREYTGNFAPGDKVFIIDRTEKRVVCDKCNGEKKLKAIVDGEEIKINCMKCKGYGEILQPIKTIKETRIENVRLTLCFRTDRVNIWSSDCVEVVGRGYSVDPEYIFKSYEDAEKSMEEHK